MFTNFKMIVILLTIASLMLAACAPATTVNTPTAQSIVFADEGFEMLYQAALSNNPQWTGTDLQKRQMFFFQYGGVEAQEVFATAYATEEQDMAFVRAANVMALKSPPAWLYALAAAVATETIIAMNAQLAANLELPTVPVEEISATAKMLLLTSSALVVNAEVEAYLQTTVLQIESIQAAEATLKQGKIIHEGVGPITWVVSSSMLQCLVNLQIWDVKNRQTLQLDNSDNRKGSDCTPEYIRKLINELVRKGIEAGLSLELMNELGDFIFKSIAAKFGW